MDKFLEAVLNRLAATGRYVGLVEQIRQSKEDISFIFEALFADSFESRGIFLRYEANVNPTKKSVDFLYQDEEGEQFCFELVSPKMSKELREKCKYVQTEVDGVLEYEVALSSNHVNPFLRPEAQTIRMQEKLLDKVCKFPEPADKVFSTITVNCSSFHFGHFDDEDCRAVMYGKTRSPAWQEYWKGEGRIRGLCEDTHSGRETPSFRRKITAVIFVPKLSPHLLNGAYIALNPNRSNHHRGAFEAKLRNMPLFNGLHWITTVAR